MAKLPRYILQEGSRKLESHATSQLARRSEKFTRTDDLRERAKIGFCCWISFSRSICRDRAAERSMSKDERALRRVGRPASVHIALAEIDSIGSNSA